MHNKKIIVDIVLPSGGKQGGVEDVIVAWTKYLNKDIFDLRIMHMTPGTAYLNGYEKAYFLTEYKEYADPSYCASGYSLLIEQLGPPDICIATLSPVMSLVCDTVRNYNKLNFPIFSWVHSEIKRYEDNGHGGVNEMLYADRHLVINSSMSQEIHNANPNAIVFNLGNPIIHDIPMVNDHSLNNKKLCFVGRLVEEKRLDIILEALYRAKSKWSLKIIGDGEIKKDVEGWVELLKLKDQVSVLGWKDNPLDYIKDCIALVSASDYEGFMVSAAEALAVGKMVISTPTQGVRDYLVDSKNGYYFDFDNAQSLANVLDDIASNQKQIPDTEICKKSVSKYLKENYFSNLAQILVNSLTYQ